MDRQSRQDGRDCWVVGAPTSRIHRAIADSGVPACVVLCTNPFSWAHTASAGECPPQPQPSLPRWSVPDGNPPPRTWTVSGGCRKFPGFKPYLGWLRGFTPYLAWRWTLHTSASGSGRGCRHGSLILQRPRPDLRCGPYRGKAVSRLCVGEPLPCAGEARWGLGYKRSTRRT